MTKQELQLAVNLADFWLSIHSAILYGLMTGPIENINTDHCQEMITRGAYAGLRPEPDFVKSLSKEQLIVLLNPQYWPEVKKIELHSVL